MRCAGGCHDSLGQPRPGGPGGPFHNPYQGSVRVQVVVMIHSGSRGLGHQVATDALTAMERAMARDGIHVNDRQLACAHINSQARPGSAF